MSEVARAAVRTAGIILVFAASSVLGNAAGERLRRRWQVLRELCELFRYLGKEIGRSRTPLAEALTLAASSGLAQLQGFLEDVARQLEECRGTPLREVWEGAVARHLGGKILDGPGLEQARAAWTALGSQDAAMQRMLLEKQETRFLSLCQDAEREYREKSGLYRKLGAAGGVFLIILLL